MSAPQFTPGPWSFCWNVPDVSKQEPTSGVAWPGKGDISQRGRIDVSGPNTLANGFLIAAAPDLFERVQSSNVALEEAAKLLEGHGLRGCASIMRGYVVGNDAALAKALGEQVPA